MTNNYIINSKSFFRLTSTLGNFSDNSFKHIYKVLQNKHLHNLSAERNISDESKLKEAITPLKNIYFSTLINNFNSSFEYFSYKDSLILLGNSKYVLPIIPFEESSADYIVPNNVCCTQNNIQSQTVKHVFSHEKSSKSTSNLIVEILNKNFNGDKSRQCLDILDTETINIYLMKDNFLLQLNTDELSQLLLPPICKQDSKRTISNNSKDRASLEQLSYIKNVLLEEFPRLLKSKHRYDIYTDDVIFENNFFPNRSFRTIGIWNYGIELIKFRLLIYAQLSNSEMNLINVNENLEEGTVELRWRITGVRHLKALMFWKYISPDDQEWLDGVSTFNVNNKGFISKHTMHRMVNDTNNLRENRILKKITINIPLPATT